MKIFPITNTIHFKQYKDDGIIGYDDSVSQETRNILRRHYDSWHMPYNSIYAKEHTKTPYEMDCLICNLERYHEMQKIGGTNIYRGQTLVEKPYAIYALKNKGIKTVVDLVGYGKTYKEEVEKAGLNYYSYNIFDNWWVKLNFSPEDIQKLVNFIKVMQQDNLYIGCQHGSNDTDIAFIINDFFNPKLAGKVKTTISPSDSDFPIKLNTIYDALTKTQKKELGWTKEFEQKLIKKLISI